MAETPESDQRDGLPSGNQETDEQDRDESGEEASALPEPLAEAMKDGSVKERVIREVFGMVTGPTQSPVARKITSEHIDRIIENDGRAQQHNHTHRTHRLIAWGLAFFSAMVFILILVTMFKDNDRIVTHLLTAAFSLLTGFLGGFGLGYGRSRDS